MKNTRQVLAVDIGNTRVHLGLIDTTMLTCSAADAFVPDALTEQLSIALASLCGRDLPAMAVVSGVVQKSVELVVSHLNSLGCSVREFSNRTPFPFTVKYRNGASLGADRCANALYASTRFPDDSVIMVSAGTAVVVDYLSNGTFNGGAILPGAVLQGRALHEFTDALPLVSFERGGRTDVPGISTDTCITGGILHGIAGAIEHIVHHYELLTTGKPPVLLATGGDWQMLSGLINRDFFADPAMTLIGTALYSLY